MTHTFLKEPEIELSLTIMLKDVYLGHCVIDEYICSQNIALCV